MSTQQTETKNTKALMLEDADIALKFLTSLYCRVEEDLKFEIDVTRRGNLRIALHDLYEMREKIITMRGLICG